MLVFFAKEKQHMITEVNVDAIDLVTRKHTVRIRKSGISVFLLEEPKGKGGAVEVEEVISEHTPIHDIRIDLT